MTTSTIDHRCGQRVPCELAAWLIVPRRPPVRARMTEFSISGALMETSILLSEMICVAVRFEHPTAMARRTRAISGYVARHTKQGLALGWMELAPTMVMELLATTSSGLVHIDTMLPSQLYF